MARRYRYAGVLGMVVLLVAACGGGAADSGRESVKLGFINPESGQFASLGTSMRQALDLYLEEHDNSLGGRQVELATVDEGAGAASAVPGARKLIQQEDVDVVTGVVSSATAAAVFPQFEQAKIPAVLTQGYPYPEVTTSPSPYLWAVGSTSANYSGSMWQYLLDNVDPAKGVYFLGSDYVQGHSVVEALRKRYEAAGGRVAGVEYAPLGTTLDFQPYLSKIASSGAGAVYGFFSGSDAVKFVQQYKSFGLAERFPLYSTASLTSGTNLAAQGPAALGVIMNATYSPQLDNPVNRTFVEDFRTKYGIEPDVFAMQQYEALMVLDSALAKADGQLDADKIIAGLRAVGTIDGPRGTWTFDDAAQFAVSPMYLLQVKDEGGTPTNAVVRELGTYSPVTGERTT